jgi:hypothetical protein
METITGTDYKTEIHSVTSAKHSWKRTIPKSLLHQDHKVHSNQRLCAPFHAEAGIPILERKKNKVHSNQILQMCDPYHEMSASVPPET